MRLTPFLLIAACAPSLPPEPEPPPAPLRIEAASARLPTGLASTIVDVRADHSLRVRPAVEPPSARAARTLQVDLLTAGTIDAHAHPIGLGRQLSELDLVDVPTYADVLAKVKNAAAGTGWLLGRGWDQNDWPDTPAGGWPLAADLDALTGGRPTALRRIDGHATWANSAALAAAGITKDTADPPGGRIIRDASGAPTGVLIDTAGDLLTVPEPDVDQVEAWLRAAQTSMLEHGLVGVHDMGVDDTTLAAWRRIDAAGDLKIRVFAYLTPDSQAADDLLHEGPTWGEHLSVVGIKAYADGALGSRGAHLSAPYADDPSTSGLAITSEEDLAELATRCLRARVQLAVHAIGDQAVTDTLDAFSTARAAVPDAAAVPLRVEHAQVVRPEDWARFRALNVVASMQPTHATSDMPWAEARLGADRIGWSYTWRAASEHGVVLALGSDFPVESVDPALGLHAATTRTDLLGQPEGGWRPDQVLDLTASIDGFTTATWAALGQPGPSLQTGQTADLTLWDRVGEPPELRAVGTVIDGEVVWLAADR